MYPARGGPSRAEAPLTKVNTPERGWIEADDCLSYVFLPKASLRFSASRIWTMTPEVTVGRGERLNPTTGYSQLDGRDGYILFSLVWKPKIFYRT